MTRYAVGVNGDFVASHFLVGGDFGAESELHSHHYRVEVTLEGSRLDGHGFLVDIVRVRESLGRLVGRFRDRTLNELPEFRGVNPSVEMLARVAAEFLRADLSGESPGSVTVKVWENEEAWASCRLTPSD